MQDSFTKLQCLLRQLFQLDTAADLDFGVYRIMNHKRTEIERFINESLPTTVDEALSSGAAARQADLAGDLEKKAEEVRQTLGPDAISPDGELDPQWSVTKIGEDYLRAQSRARGAADQEELKATIFKHLHTFFSRYYDNGDFLSKQRHSERQKYAIPYNGEEVYLHWANADQYYVKTGEHFTDYRYVAENGVTVQFKLNAANVEHNNVKGADRYFVPHATDASYDAETRLFTIPFEHRPLTGQEERAHGSKGNGRQDRINEKAAAELLDRFKGEPEALAALNAERRKNSSGKPVSYLEHHLRRYTTKNTSDFFVHKNLEGFLEGEFDFYLKNEVLEIDDLDRWGEEGAGGWFEVMRAMKRIGREIIAFLAQIEDFQKKLFEKKKFVTSAEYCLTLDNLPEDLYPEILENDAQLEEWERLFSISEIEGNVLNGGEQLSVGWLRDNPHLVLDTRFFSRDFKDRLLSSIEDLDERTDGLLIDSENFQALTLMQARYREQVKCIYIDPPYNAVASEILYKNGYKHSSWLSLISDRLYLSRLLMDTKGVLCVTIDDHEHHRLQALLLQQFGKENHLGTVLIRNNPSGRSTVKGFAINHEYALYYSASENLQEIGRLPHTEQQRGRYEAAEEKDGLTKQYEWENLRKSSSESNRMDRPKQFYPIYYNRNTERIRVPEMTWQDSANRWDVLEEPESNEVEILPVNNSGVERVWQWGHERVRANVSEMKVEVSNAGPQIYKKKYWNEAGVLPRTWWDKPSYSARDSGTATVTNL